MRIYFVKIELVIISSVGPERCVNPP